MFVVTSRPSRSAAPPQLTYTTYSFSFSFLTMASSSSSSPELSHPLHTHPPNPYKYSTIEEVLDDLSRSALIQLLFGCYQSVPSRFILNLPDNELASLERICFQVEQAYDPSYPNLTHGVRNLSFLSDIGTMKILSERKIPNSHHYISKNSQKCFSMPVLSLNDGEVITTVHSTISCDTRPECPSAAQSCSTTPGIRSKSYYSPMNVSAQAA